MREHLPGILCTSRNMISGYIPVILCQQLTEMVKCQIQIQMPLLSLVHGSTFTITYTIQLTEAFIDIFRNFISHMCVSI